MVVLGELMITHPMVTVDLAVEVVEMVANMVVVVAVIPEETLEKITTVPMIVVRVVVPTTLGSTSTIRGESTQIMDQSLSLNCNLPPRKNV
uniref:Uncharacterized protein n=1 Tax=Candidatus Kentrum sp. SD TaxID=2126332 RepID=A0A451BSC8_9GAMM|nr:MAG: hypothetical protein BECKSD772D_GA0070982_12462 [Candidatus Kentron sp. SD]